MIIHGLLNNRLALSFPLLRKSYAAFTISKIFPTTGSLYFRSKFRSYHSTMDLPSVIKTFENFIPKHLAEKWDNTGLLLEPQQKNSISTIFFTNDLTEDVLKEALAAKSNLIISYHPPLFTAFKTLRQENWKDRIIMTCIANNIAIYSPHTACDAVEGGVNDWLLKCFDVTDVLPIKLADEMNCVVIECIAQCDIATRLSSILDKGIEFTVLMKSTYEERTCYKILASSLDSATICQTLLANPGFVSVSSTPTELQKNDNWTGMGRTGKMKTSLKLQECINLVKKQLKLKNVRLALGIDCTTDTEITTVAVCAGSGASVLKGVPADLYVTGEMSHHDLLDAIHKKTSVILCEHSNSERGYLVELVDILRPNFKGINLVVSKVDKDPIAIV